MKTTLLGALMLVAGTAQAQTPDDPTDPTNPDPDPTTDVDPDPVPTPTTPDPIPTPPPQPVPTYDPTPQQPVTNVTVVAPDDDEQEAWYSMNRLGVGLTVGGGVAGFTTDTLRSTAQDGGNWDVRLGFGTRLPVSLEAAYIGSAQEIDALGLDSDAILIGNGLQGNIRVNATAGDIPVQPFLFGGIAWRRYTLQNTDTNTSDVLGEDDVLEIPMGVGFGFKTGGLLLDVRGEYRRPFLENLVPGEGATEVTIDDDRAGMHRWGVNANLGVEF